MTTRVVAALNGVVLLVGLVAVGPSAVRPAPEVRSADAALSAAAAAPAPPPVVDAAVAEPVAPAQGAPPETPPEPAAAAPAPPAPASEQPAAPRVTTTTGYAPYATTGPVVLHAPGNVVEAIGFHQSGNDGAQPQNPVPGLAARAGLLDQRGRDTDRAGASDVVVDPSREIRSPVTGTVLRASSYTLYCRHVDEFLVIEPDARPGWEVKVLHVQGLSAVRGQRVQAGVTVVAAGARALPFASQVDEFTGDPSWPHVHIEVVDPSVPDRPGNGGGGGC